MSNIIPFDFNGKQVRVMMIDGEPWWVAKDVCEVLEIVNSRDAIAKLDDDETRVGLTDMSRNATYINESGLYTLILRSDKPEAKPFRKWVTSKVLPQIRRTGSYQPEQPKLPYRQEAVETARAIDEIDQLLHNNPRLAQVLIDHAMNDIIDKNLIAPSNEPELRGLVEIALDMGYKKASDSSLRVKLGKYVADVLGYLAIKEKRICNGAMRDINCYPDTPQVRTAIDGFFTLITD